MSEILLIKFLHLLAFVYWLGGDLGTYYASTFVARSDLDTKARSTALDIMMGVDQAPRICMPLILGLGVHLAYKMGYMDVSPAIVALTWIITIAWITMVWAIHNGHGKSWLAGLQKFDLWFRYLMIVLVGGSAIYALITGEIYQGDWLATKALIFALLMMAGVVLRYRLKNFVPAWIALNSEGPSDEVNQTIRKSLVGCRPIVLAIWVGLLINAALGLHLINF